MEFLQDYKYVYRIDENDVIIFVDQDWLTFAQENNAQNLTADRVIGTALWNYIEGAETRELYRELFSKLRKNNVMAIIPYRCDSPDMYRSLDLAICPLDDWTLELRSHVINIESREYNPLLDASLHRSKEVYEICSFCKGVKFPNNVWSSLEHLLMRTNLDELIIPELSNVVCPACRGLVEDALLWQ
jgi:hypothetical protein